jgi:hypothetical protein
VGAAAEGTVADAVATADLAAANLEGLAAGIGESWATELVDSLRSAERGVIGAWPGTMSEARMRIRVALRMHVPASNLDDLARIAIVAARRSWHSVAESDPEP